MYGVGAQVELPKESNNPGQENVVKRLDRIVYINLFTLVGIPRDFRPHLYRGGKMHFLFPRGQASTPSLVP